jgi:hypothetical protein
MKEITTSNKPNENCNFIYTCKRKVYFAFARFKQNIIRQRERKRERERERREAKTDNKASSLQKRREEGKLKNKLRNHQKAILNKRIRNEIITYPCIFPVRPSVVRS